MVVEAETPNDGLAETDHHGREAQGRLDLREKLARPYAVVAAPAASGKRREPAIITGDLAPDKVLP